MTEFTGKEWQVNLNVPDDVAYEALAQDRIWNAFSIADLEPPFRAFSRIAVAQRTGATQSATCLIFESPAFNTISPHGDPAGVAAILSAVKLPARTGVLVRSEHLVPVSRLYDFPNGLQPMIRMATDAAKFRPTLPVQGLVRLGQSDLEELRDLYTGFPGNHFAPIQLEHGVYFGVRNDGRFVAAGGTHVVCPRYGIAVLGGIYTHPLARGRGYASAITSALVAELLDSGCRDVVLNVHAENETARRVYDRIGFCEHCPYETGEAILRDDIDA